MAAEDLETLLFLPMFTAPLVGLMECRWAMALIPEDILPTVLWIPPMEMLTLTASLEATAICLPRTM